MRKRLIILVVIDIILIGTWYMFLNTAEIPEMAAIGFLLMLPALMLFSGLIGLILYWQKSPWGDPIMINMIISLAMYFGIWMYEARKQNQKQSLYQIERIPS